MLVKSLKITNLSLRLHVHIYSMTTFDTQDIFIVRAYLTKQTVPAIHKVVIMSWIGLLCT